MNICQWLLQKNATNISRAEKHGDFLRGRLNRNLSETLYYKTVSRNPKGKQKSKRQTLETTGTDTHQEEEPLEEQTLWQWTSENSETEYERKHKTH